SSTPERRPPPGLFRLPTQLKVNVPSPPSYATRPVPRTPLSAAARAASFRLYRGAGRVGGSIDCGQPTRRDLFARAESVSSVHGKRSQPAGGYPRDSLD